MAEWLEAHHTEKFKELLAAGLLLKFTSGKSRINRIYGIESVKELRVSCLCACVSVCQRGQHSAPPYGNNNGTGMLVPWLVLVVVPVG